MGVAAYLRLRECKVGAVGRRVRMLLSLLAAPRVRWVSGGAAEEQVEQLVGGELLLVPAVVGAVLRAVAVTAPRACLAWGLERLRTVVVVLFPLLRVTQHREGLAYSCKQDLFIKYVQSYRYWKETNISSNKNFLSFKIYIFVHPTFSNFNKYESKNVWDWLGC